VKPATQVAAQALRQPGSSLLGRAGDPPKDEKADVPPGLLNIPAFAASFGTGTCP